MGATLSQQKDSKCEEDEEQHSGQDEDPEDSAKEQLLQNNGQISSQNGRKENQTDEKNSLSEERDLAEVGSGFVTLREDVSDSTNSVQEDVSQSSTDNNSKQINNTDETIAKDENEANNTLSDTEIGFKKIFKFGGVKFTLKKDKVEKIDVDQLHQKEKVQDRNATGPSSDSWDNMHVNPVNTNEQDAAETMNEIIEGDASAESPETHNEKAVDKCPELTEHRREATPNKGLKENVPQFPEPEEPMSPIKRFFSQGILANLRKKKKEEDRPKENEELKALNEVIEKDTTKEDTTCMCLDVSNGAFDKDKDIQLYKKEESKPAAEGDLMNFIEQDKVQASPFKRLFRKLSTRRQSETKPDDPNLLEPGENITENPQFSTELIKSQKAEESKVVKTQPADEMMDTSNELSKKKTDSTVSWENLICVKSAKTRTRKTSDSEEETHDKGEVPRRTAESPLESSTEGDHLTSSNEQGKSPAEEDSGSTWKSLKKLVTPKRKSVMEESGSLEQMQSDTDISKDESSCSLRKLISGRKKIKPDGQQENTSSDEGSRGAGTDIEDDETPGVVPLSEYEVAEQEILNTMNDGTTESKNEKDMQPMIEEDKPKQMQPLYNIQPLCFDARPSSVPVPTEYMEELTEFLSKHQQLSDIPEEGIIEETAATPLSNVEWITQDDTLADDIDMTADAVTAPEHASEYNGDETTEMMSAVSQLSESPKTSGNVTPISPAYNLRESDTIFQEVVETVNMIPSVLAITTRDEIPEALAVSVSKFIVESTSTTETKVLVTHKKEEATSICIGIASQEIRGAEFVLPLPLVEGISEITHSVPTEFVSEEMTEESQVAGTSTDNVYKAEIKEIKSMLYEVLLLHEQSTILAETTRKSNQQIIVVENIQEEVPFVLQMEGVENNSTELLNGIDEFTPVHAAVHGGAQVIEEEIITINTNGPEAEGQLQPALEEAPCEQLTQETKIIVEVEKDHRILDAESSAADVEELAVAEEAGLVEHNVVETFLIGTSKNTEDDVQVTEIAKSVTHSVVHAEPEPAKNQATEITEDMIRVLVSDVYSETSSTLSKVIPILDSNEREIDLENVDSPTIHVKANNTESQSAKKNVETVLALDTTLDVAEAFENIKMIEEEEKAQQKTEPTSTEMIKGTGDEKNAYNFKAENFAETIDEPTTEEREGKESESNTFTMESVADTNEDNVVKEPGDMSEVSLEKIQTETDTILIEDSKKKQTADDEIRAIPEQVGDDEEMALDGIQPPTTDNSKPVSQATIYKLTADTETTAEAPGSKDEEDLAKTEVVKRLCIDDKLSVHEHGLNETPKPEMSPEIITKLETAETVASFPEAEPQLDPNEPQTESLPLKPEKSQTTESLLEHYEENNQATESIIQMTETISSTVTFKCEEEAGMKFNMSDQPVTTLHCFNGIDRVSSSEKVKGPCVDDQSVMSDTLLAEEQEDEETAQPEVHTEIIPEQQEAVETGKTLLKPEESQATESSHEPYQESNQEPETADLTKAISSDLHEEGTGMESNMSEQPVETGQCLKGEGGVPISTTEHSTEVLSEDIVESPENVAISKAGVSEHVIKVMNAGTCQVAAEVVSELEAERTLGSEQNIISSDVTEQQVVSEIDISNAAAAEKKNIELTAVLKLKEETTITMSEEQTAVTSKQLAESQIVTEIKTEPEVQTQVLTELKAETQEVIEPKADIILVSEVQAETPVVPSLVTELELETPVVTSTEKSIDTKTLALTSVVNKLQLDLKTVSEAEDSTGTALQEGPIGVSEIQTTTGLSLAQTPIIKEVLEKEDAHINRPVIDEVNQEPRLETRVVTEVISHTSAGSSLELQTTKTSALETITLVSTCVEKNVETLRSVVTSIKENTDVDSSVVITTASEVQLKTPVVQTFMELTATDIPASQNPIDGQLVQEPKMIMVAQEIKETKLETLDAVEVKELPQAKEIRVEAPSVTEQVIKEAVLTLVVPECEETSVKEDMGPSVFTLFAEETTEASCIKLSTSSVAPVVQTSIMVPTEVQRPNVVPVVDTLAANSAVIEEEMPSTGPGVKERHCDAQVSIHIEVKSPSLTESEFKITEITEQRTQEEDVNSGTLKEVSVPVVKIVEPLPEADDDVWEDAVDDISDDQCSSTNTSGCLQDFTMCHDDK